VRERLHIILRKIERELKPSGIKESDTITLFQLVNFVFSRKGIKRIWRIFYKIFRVVLRYCSGKKGLSPLYSKWLKKYNTQKPDLSVLKAEIESWAITPLISVIMPVYNPDKEHLIKAVNSVLEQVYTNWELCISDDGSNEETILILQEISANNSKIKVHYRTENGNISLNMNNAVEMSSGYYLSFLDQDDMLANDALYFVAKKCIETNADIIYSDEDKINDKGDRFDPYFKPQWSPHTLLSRNYVNHLFTIKRSLFDQVGGFRVGFEGAQDHDLLLRATNKTTKIEHIPEVLYHWRVHNNSTSYNPESKQWAFKAGVIAVKEHISELGYEAEVNYYKPASGNYIVDIKVADTPKVSIIIPTKDKPEVLEKCLRSIFEKTEYTNFEVLVIDNNSNQAETFNLFKEYEQRFGSIFRVEKYADKFNYSAIQNFGALQSNGEYLLLLNNDTEVINANWIEKMISYAQLNNAGAVGVKLYYPNSCIQHVGVVLGINGIVGHAFVGSDGNHPGYYHNNNLVTNYSAVTAACLMVSKNKFDEVGGFDEKLAIEYNDVDFCLKLYSKGYYNIYLPQVELIHYESISRGHPAMSKESFRQSQQEGSYFKSKWNSLIERDPFYNPNLTLEHTEFQFNV